MNTLLVFCFVILSKVNCQDISYRFDYTYNHDLGGSMKFHRVPDTWPNATYKCEIEGASIAWPQTKTMLDKMVDMMTKQNIPQIFLGIHSLFSKGDFSSIDGVPLSRIPIKWLPGQPDNAGYNEDCLTLTKEGFSADVDCSLYYPYMCFLEHNTTIAKNKCGTVDDAYTFDERTNSCYKLHKLGQSWNMAFKTCYAEGGHLMVIDSDVKKMIASEILDEGIKYNPSDCRDYYLYKNQSFTGFYNWKDIGWHTVYGNSSLSAEYTSCKKFLEPLGSGDTCASFDFHSTVFSNTPCTNKLPYICEKSPGSLLGTSNVIF